MPTVPYNPVPTASPTEKGAPNISVNAPAAAFGSEMGEAIGNLGKGIEKAGGEIFQRAMALQELRNDAEAKEADARFTIELGKLHADFNTLQGKDAVEGYDKYREDIRQLREGIGSELSSDRAKKLYDSTSRGQAARSIFNGAGYAATQNKNYLLTASEARVKANADSFYQDPDKNPAQFEGEVRIEALQRAAIKGWAPDDPQTKEMVAADISKGWLNKITGLANTRPFEARTMFDENKGKLHGDDIRKAETIVENRSHNVGSRGISDRIMRPIYESPEGVKEKPLEQLVKEGEAIAEKQFPDDPVMKGFVRERITIDYNRFKSVRRETINTDTATVEEAISGKAGGKMLYSEDEIKSLGGKYAAAWEALPEAKKRALRSVMVKNSREDWLETPDSRDEFRRLRGMAALEPDKFLTETEAGISGMPRAWKEELENKRIALLKRGDADPRVGAAIRTIVQKYGDAVPKKADGEKRYYTFVGAVQDMMTEYEQEYKKPMPFKEKLEMGAFLLQAQSNKFLPEWLSKPDRNFDLLPKEIEKLKSDPRWEAQGVKPPTDEVLRQMLIRKLYTNAYQKAKAKSKDQEPLLKGSPIGATGE